MIRTAVMRALTSKGYAVAAANTAMSGLQLAVSEHPDVVVLDLGLPDLDGREVLRMIRAVSKVPIIVATSRGTEEDIVRSLDAGADDYVVKPYGGAQLDARIRAVLRRTAEPTEDPVIEVGGLLVDRRARRASVDGNDLDLTPREFDLLHYLAARAGTVVTKQELLVEIWQQPYGGSDKSLDVHLVLAAPQARRVGDRTQVPAYGAPGRRPAGRAGDGVRAGPRRYGSGRAGFAGAGLMRRRLSLLVSATMAVTLLAFAIPLAILIRVLAADRAVASANDDVRALSALVAAAPDPASVRQDLQLAGRPMTVFLPGHRPIGAPAKRTPDVQLAERGTSFTVADPGGRQILIAVRDCPTGRRSCGRSSAMPS